MPRMILILDFGSQYTQLIARRVREARVYCEIHPYNLPLEQVRALNPKGIILSGGAPPACIGPMRPISIRRFSNWAARSWEFATVCS